MKKEFIGFYMPTTDELKSAWESEETKFIFDTNVLLKLYRVIFTSFQNDVEA